MSGMQVFLAILVIAAVTALLRFLPFILFSGRKTPLWLIHFGMLLPYAVMGMLVVYCLKGTYFGSLSGFLPALISGAVVVGSYAWKKNTLVSIVGGTVCYMLLVQLVF